MKALKLFQAIKSGLIGQGESAEYAETYANSITEAIRPEEFANDKILSDTLGDLSMVLAEIAADIEP